MSLGFCQLCWEKYSTALQPVYATVSSLRGGQLARPVDLVSCTHMRRTLMAYSGRTRIDDIGELANTPTSGSLMVPIAARCCSIRPEVA